jgi:hypothetical protein
MENRFGPSGSSVDLTAHYLLTHPNDVISDLKLSKVEKRAILAGWASDARAVEDAPELRRLDNGAFVRIDEVLNALRLLDGSSGQVLARRAGGPPFDRKRRRANRILLRNKPHDDGPPPCGAGARMPTHPMVTMAVAR